MTHLPNHPDAERAVLGSILLNREAIAAVASWFKSDAFYLECHRLIYAAALDLYDRSTPADIRLLSAELTARGQLELVGGIGYLADLSDAVPTSSHIEHYARLVARAATQRNLIAAGGRIAAIGYDQEQDEAAALAAAQAELDALAEGASGDDDLTPLAEIVDQQYERAHAAAENGAAIETGLLTGYRDLDDLLGGLHRGDLIILAARPAVGKSSLAASIAYNVGQAGGGVGVFSLEMGKDQYVQRLAAMDSGINLHDLRTGQMRDEELATYMATLGRLHAMPIAISDASGATVRDLRARIKRHTARNGPIDLAIVDYLQLMTGPVSRGGSREQEVAAISRGLKGLARELDVPVLALAQLSRAVEGRSSHVPMLSDLRESGAIENDADIVMFIYREELYDKETDKKGIAEIHIAKHRNGPIGIVPMRFEASTTRFMDLSYRTLDGY